MGGRTLKPPIWKPILNKQSCSFVKSFHLRKFRGTQLVCFSRQNFSTTLANQTKANEQMCRLQTLSLLLPIQTGYVQDFHNPNMSLRKTEGSSEINFLEVRLNVFLFYLSSQIKGSVCSCPRFSRHLCRKQPKIVSKNIEHKGTSLICFLPTETQLDVCDWFSTTNLHNSAPTRCLDTKSIYAALRIRGGQHPEGGDISERGG